MKVSFRAVFSGPKGVLNPSALKSSRPIEVDVEVFQIGDNWYARSAQAETLPMRTRANERDYVASGDLFAGAPPERSSAPRRVSPSRAVFEELGVHPTHGCAKDAVAAAFQKRLTPWKWFDADGRELDPDSVEETPDGKFSRRIFTHIAHESQIGQPGNHFKTVCGETVNSYQLRSKRGTAPPDCKTCRAAWDEARKTVKA